MKKKSKLKTGFNIIISIALLVALFVYVVILFNTITKKEVTLNFFRWKPFIVVADYAEADIYAGDVAIIKDVKTEEIKPGDIIVYREGNNGAIKKVKDIKNINNQTTIIVDSDGEINNKSMNSSIEGKYMFKIAGLGNIMLFLQTPLGGIILFSFLIYIILIIKLISSRSNKEEVEKIDGEKIQEHEEDTLKINNKTSETSNEENKLESKKKKETLKTDNEKDELNSKKKKETSKTNNEKNELNSKKKKETSKTNNEKNELDGKKKKEISKTSNEKNELDGKKKKETSKIDNEKDELDSKKKKSTSKTNNEKDKNASTK